MNIKLIANDDLMKELTKLLDEKNIPYNKNGNDGEPNSDSNIYHFSGWISKLAKIITLGDSVAISSLAEIIIAFINRNKGRKVSVTVENGDAKKTFEATDVSEKTQDQIIKKILDLMEGDISVKFEDEKNNGKPRK